MSAALAETLGNALHYKVRQSYERMWRAMWRDLDWFAENRPHKMVRVYQNGWTLHQIKVVAVLNAFNRAVIGPLGAAFDTPVNLGIGTRLPLAYGSSLRVSRETAAPLKAAFSEFQRITRDAGIQKYWLNLGSADDLVYSIGRTEDHGSAEDTD